MIVYASGMNKRTPLLAAILLGFASLVFSGCSTGTKSPYFGIDDHNKRFVPRELHEDGYD